MPYIRYHFLEYRAKAVSGADLLSAASIDANDAAILVSIYDKRAGLNNIILEYLVDSTAAVGAGSTQSSQAQRDEALETMYLDQHTTTTSRTFSDRFLLAENQPARPASGSTPASPAQGIDALLNLNA